VGHCLRAENITKRVGRKEILHEISLELIGGNIYGFIGKTDPERQCCLEP